jgi:tRNA threonylcarbamoyl adenosine modification protein (Sua5/YciO/YrdC/YwlC family)
LAAPIQSIDRRHPQPRSLERALQSLRAGALVAFPSDTGYAVACDLHSKKGAEQLARLKPRAKGHPPVLVCATIQQISHHGRLSDAGFRALKKLVPGPYTFVLEATREVPRGLLGAGGRVALRLPDAATPRALVEAMDAPLLIRSATHPDGERLLDGAELKAAWGDQLALILDAGPAEPGPSTVLSLIDDGPPQLLREGVGQL